MNIWTGGVKLGVKPVTARIMLLLGRTTVKEVASSMEQVRY